MGIADIGHIGGKFGGKDIRRGKVSISALRRFGSGARTCALPRLLLHGTNLLDLDLIYFL